MSAPSWAVPGAKVVCIQTAPDASRVPGGAYPEVGVIYTIRKVVMTTKGHNKGRYSLLLHEIANSPLINQMLGEDSPLEPSMPISAFRPLVSKTIEDDMKHFLPLLNTIGEDA